MPKFTPFALMLALAATLVTGCQISDPDRSASAPPQACGVPPDCEDI